MYGCSSGWQTQQTHSCFFFCCLTYNSDGLDALFFLCVCFSGIEEVAEYDPNLLSDPQWPCGRHKRVLIFASYVVRVCSFRSVCLHAVKYPDCTLISPVSWFLKHHVNLVFHDRVTWFLLVDFSLWTPLSLPCIRTTRFLIGFLQVRVCAAKTADGESNSRAGGRKEKKLHVAMCVCI